MIRVPPSAAPVQRPEDVYIHMAAHIQHQWLLSERESEPQGLREGEATRQDRRRLQQLFNQMPADDVPLTKENEDFTTDQGAPGKRTGGGYAR
jgi:hypothetical protein